MTDMMENEGCDDTKVTTIEDFSAHSNAQAYEDIESLTHTLKRACCRLVSFAAHAEKLATGHSFEKMSRVGVHVLFAAHVTMLNDTFSSRTFFLQPCL